MEVRGGEGGFSIKSRVCFGDGLRFVGGGLFGFGIVGGV